MTTIEVIRWEGDLEGVLHLEGQLDSEGNVAWVFDRPGDVVALCTGSKFPSEQHLAALALYGIALASRGIEEPGFVKPIVEKTAKFVATIDPSSLVLFKELGDLKAKVADSERIGLDLRQFVLDEAHAALARAQAG